jgi:hypothetical protein
MTPAPTGAAGRPRMGVAALVLLGLAGVLGAAIVTRAGAGLDADSVTYLDAAQNLVRGRGLTLTPGLSVESNPLAPAPFTHHPPLFPALLGAFAWLGVDALAGARWLNVLLLGVNGFLVGLTVLSWTGSRRLALLGTLLVMGSVDVFKTHAWVLTEPIFLTGVLAGLWALALDLERPRHLALAGAVVAIALASLARYAGLALIGTGALAIALWSPLRSPHRWTRAALFAVAASAPLIAWLARNRATQGTLTGKRLVVHTLPGDRARQGLDTLSGWLLPDVAPRMARYAVLLLAALLVLAAWWYARGRGETGPASRRMRVGARLLGLFALLYGSLVYATISFFDAHVPLDGRLLAPLYAVAVVLALAGVARLSSRAPGVRSLALGAMVLLAGVSLTRTGLWAVGSQLDEMGYASRLWRESALVAEVKALRDDVRVFSNAPDALYVLTGRPARLVPLTADPFTRQENTRYAEDFGRLERDLRGRSGVVVYFRWLRWRWYLPSERELIQRLGLVTIATAREGAMYGAPD